MLEQLIEDGDPVDSLAAVLERRHAEEDAAVLLEREVLRLESAGHLDEERIVKQDRAEDEPLGIEVYRKTFFKRDVGCRHLGTKSY